jgi:hypothetical protein
VRDRLWDAFLLLTTLLVLPVAIAQDVRDQLRG